MPPGPPPHSGAVRRVLLLATLSNLFFYCSELPLIRLAEHKICKESPNVPHTPNASPDHCRTPAIQDAAAWFIGVRTATDAVPPLLVSTWYGVLAAKRRRRLVVALACGGELLNVGWVMFVCLTDVVHNVRLGWLAALFLFVGGGQFLLYAMFSLTIVDVAPVQQRTRSLAMLHSITLLSSLIGPPVSGILLDHSLSTPLYAIVSLAVARFPIIWLLPESPSQAWVKNTSRHILPEDHMSASESDPLVAVDVANIQPDETSTKTHYKTLLDLLQIASLPFCFLCFFAKRIAFTSEVFMYQYLAEKLDSTLDHSSWFRIPIGLGAATTLYLTLPTALSYLQRRGHDTFTVDVWLIRSCLAILICAFGLFWVVSGPIALTLALLLCGAGEGLAPLLQGLVSTLVSSEQHSYLFASISVADTMAKLVGGLIMGKAFSIRGANGESYGLCFLLAALLFATIAVLSFTPLLRPHRISQPM